jgi:hypothetical protein
MAAYTFITDLTTDDDESTILCTLVTLDQQLDDGFFGDVTVGAPYNRRVTVEFTASGDVSAAHIADGMFARAAARYELTDGRGDLARGTRLVHVNTL